MCVSQHALGRRCVYPSTYWARQCVSQHALGRGFLPGGSSGRGCLPGGCLPGGACHTPPVNRITTVCENIILPQLRNYATTQLRTSSASALVSCCILSTFVKVSLVRMDLNFTTYTKPFVYIFTMCMVHQTVTVIDIRHNSPVLGLFCFLRCECGISRANVQTLHYVNHVNRSEVFPKCVRCVFDYTNCNVEAEQNIWHRICLEFVVAEFSPHTFHRHRLGPIYNEQKRKCPLMFGVFLWSFSLSHPLSLDVNESLHPQENSENIYLIFLFCGHCGKSWIRHWRKPKGKTVPSLSQRNQTNAYLWWCNRICDGFWKSESNMQLSSLFRILTDLSCFDFNLSDDLFFVWTNCWLMQVS